MPIHHWPEQERPREKLWQHGADKLSDAELLSLFIGSGTVHHTALDIARILFETYGSWRGLFIADAEALRTCKGLGLAKIVNIKAAFEVGKRFLQDMLKEVQPLSQTTLRQYMIIRLRDLTYEQICCMLLSNDGCMIRCITLSRGTIDQAVVYPRELIRLLLHHNASYMVLAHNHPSGCSTPTTADRNMTAHVKAACAMIQVQLLDHLIIGRNTIVSFADEGLL
jgi:DNA repair protein RadC